MTAIWMTARAEWRQRWRSFVLLTLLAGIAGGVALVAFTGSRRAETSFARLEDRVKTPNLFVWTDERPAAEVVREAASWPQSGGETVALRVVGRHLQPAEDTANSGMLVTPQGFENARRRAG